MRLADATGLRIGGQDVIEAKFNGDIVWSQPTGEQTAFEEMADAAFDGGHVGAIYIMRPTVDGTVALYQDASGTVPSDSHLDPIKYVVDVSGQGKHAIQNDANPAGLVLHTDGSTWWAVSDNTQNRPLIPASVITANTSSIVIGYTETGTDNSVILGAATDTGSAFLIGLDASTSTTINGNVTYTDLRGDGAALTLPTNRDEMWDVISLNNVITALGLTFSSTFITQATRMLGYDGAGWEAEGIYRAMVITDKALSGADLNTVESYITSLYWPDATFDLFVVAGQSNAEGQGDSASSPSVAVGTAYEYNGTSFIHLADPVGGASTGSAWPAFCDGYYDIEGNIPVIAEVAVSSTAQHSIADFGPGHWEAGSTLSLALIDTVNDMIAYAQSQGLSYRWRGILWAQGERDAEQIQNNGSYDMTMYESAFTAMYDSFKTALGNDTLLWWSRVGERGDVASGYDTAYANMRAAQDGLAASTVGVTMAFTGAFGFRDAGKMSDNHHYTQVGYNEMGAGMQATMIGAPAVEDITQVGTPTHSDGTGTSPSVTKPTGAAEFDVAIFTLSAKGSGSVLTLPAGVTELFNGNVPNLAIGNSKIAIGHLVLGASEPASYSATISASVNYAMSCSMWRGVDPTTVLDVAFASNVDDDAGDPPLPPAPSVTTVTNKAAIITVVADSRGPLAGSMDPEDYYTPPVGTTEVVDANGAAGGTSYVGHAAGWDIKTIAGATGTRLWTCIDNNDGGFAGTIALRPKTTTTELQPEDVFPGAAGAREGSFIRIRPENLRQLTDGTVAVTGAGDPVRYILDESVNGRHWVLDAQSVNPAIYQTDGTSHWLVCNDTGFNSVDDWSFMSNNPYTVAAAIELDSTAPSEQYFFGTIPVSIAGSDENNAIVHVGARNSTTATIAHWFDDHNFTHTFQATPERHIAEYKNPGSEYTIDGTQIDVSATEPTALGGAGIAKATLMWREPLSVFHRFCNGNFYGGIFVIDTISTEEKTEFDDWLQQQIPSI